jgi:hypothetical protein
MAGKKATPASGTGRVMGDAQMSSSSPATYGFLPPGSETREFAPGPATPPNMNMAAMRGYTRNAPYMEEVLSDPQTIMREIYGLQTAMARNPGAADETSAYRLRILQQALQDIYGMQPSRSDVFTARAVGPTTPMR